MKYNPFLIESIINRRNVDNKIYLCDISRFLGIKNFKKLVSIQDSWMSMSKEHLEKKLFYLCFPVRIKELFNRLMSVRIRIYFDGGK